MNEISSILLNQHHPESQQQQQQNHQSFSTNPYSDSFSPSQQQQQQQEQKTSSTRGIMSETSSQELQSIDDVQVVIDSNNHHHNSTHAHIGDEDYDEIDEMDDDEDDEMNDDLVNTTRRNTLAVNTSTTRVMTLSHTAPDKIITVMGGRDDDADIYYQASSYATNRQQQQQEGKNDNGEIEEMDSSENGGKRRTFRIFRNLMRIGIILSLFGLFIGIVVMIVQVIEYTHQRNVNRLTIFLNLSPECNQMAIELNRELNRLDVNNEVNLETVLLPQITLFSAQFLKEDEKEIIQSIKYSMVNMTRFCNMTLDHNVTVSDAYALWWVSNSPCLQTMSDLIVNATYGFVDRKARYNIPNWVLNIKDDKTREKKSEMIRKYGSPNVFSQFTPHVVLGYDSKTRNLLSQAVEHLSVTECTFGSNMILSVGKTAPRGMVSRSGIVWSELIETVQRSLVNHDREEFGSLDEDDLLFNFNLV